MNSEETPPRPPGLRAADTDRRQVADVLSTAYAEGRLTHEEHEERLEQAMRARTFAELLPLTEDLVPLDRSLPGAVENLAPAVDVSLATPGRDQFVAVFSRFARGGQWRVRARNQFLALFGRGELDLREAVLEHRRIEILGLTLFGGVDIIVPEGMAVRDETVAIFGGSSARVPPAPEGAPQLVLKGLCLFGGVEVTAGRRRSRRDRGADH